MSLPFNMNFFGGWSIDLKHRSPFSMLVIEHSSSSLLKYWNVIRHMLHGFYPALILHLFLLSHLISSSKILLYPSLQNSAKLCSSALFYAIHFSICLSKDEKTCSYIYVTYTSLRKRHRHHVGC